MVNSGLKKIVGLIGVSFLLAFNGILGGNKETSDRLNEYLHSLFPASKKMNYMASGASRNHAVISS